MKNAVLACLLGMAFALPAHAEKPAPTTLGVMVGSTPIDQGRAIHRDDITIYNDKIAVSFAVGSNNYWNMTNGSILDIAVMKDGKFGTDLVNDVEFLNDLWTATGSYNKENLLRTPVSDITYTKDNKKVVVTAKTRYWKAEHAKPLNVTLEYTLEAGKNYVGMKTTVENPAGNEPYANMYSGYSISTLAANMYGPFGYYPDVKITGIGIGADKDVQEQLGDFVVTYGKDYAVSVQMDGANAYKGSSGYKDLYILRTIEPGKTYTYTGEILVTPKGETAPILERSLEKNPSMAAARVQGQVKDASGKPVPYAAVIVSKKGGYKETVKSHGADAVKKDILQPLVWKIADKDGNYSLRLPKGDYSLHAEAKGLTPVAAQAISLKADTKMNFAMKDGAKAVFHVVDEKGNPIHTKVEVSGVTSSVKTLGATVFFADPKTRAVAFDVAAPETDVTFTVTRGHDFASLPVVIKKRLKPLETLTEKVVLPTLVQTASRNWYNADIHQHSDIGDGASPVKELYKGQLAAGLDLHAISDHDSVDNNAAMLVLSRESGLPFLSSLEVSPGWGHWGILGVDFAKKPISPDLTPAEIIKAGHDQNAMVVMNHPFSDYGFLNNRKGVTGGFDAGSEDFDFLELQSTINLKDPKNMDKRALDAAMEYWNKGKKVYLSAGSDQHDVTSGLYPGIIRLYAHVEGPISANAFMQAMKAGNSYVTMGPIITPAATSMFGSTQHVAAGKALSLQMELQAVHGLSKVSVFSEGKEVAAQELNGTKDPVAYAVQLTPEKDTWYNVVVQDAKGRYAVSNPVWVTVGK